MNIFLGLFKKVEVGQLWQRDSNIQNPFDCDNIVYVLEVVDDYVKFIDAVDVAKYGIVHCTNEYLDWCEIGKISILKYKYTEISEYKKNKFIKDFSFAKNIHEISGDCEHNENPNDCPVCGH